MTKTSALIEVSGKTHYRVSPADKLIWAHWESDSNVFNRATGETHQLSVLPSEVALVLTDQALTLGALSAALAERCETTDEPAWREKVASILRELLELEIVDSVVS